MSIRNVALSLAALAIAAGSAVAQTSTTSTSSNLIGPVGVGSTETVQINVVNLASNSSSGTAASCAGSITFNNSAGNPIGTSTSFTVAAGQIFSASLAFSKISSSTARTEVMGVVSLTSSSTNRAPCSLHYSLETYDSTTGATHVYVSGAAAPVPVPFGR